MRCLVNSGIVLLLVIFSLPFAGHAQPGCPFVDAGPDLSVDCGVSCVDLTADYLETGATTDYIVESIPYAPPVPLTGGTQEFIGADDVWGGVITLPFDFCFYGNTYNQLIIGANGIVSFDVSLSGQDCDWWFIDAIPSGNLYTNCIMGAYHDMDPTAGGTLITLFPPTFDYPADINYTITGSAPCRIFAVSFTTVPQYSCTSQSTTQQIVLYETTNIIEVYVQNKPLCAGWNNGGNSVIGIQNASGTSGVTPPGRNTGGWAASNEGWRFLPDGAPTHTIKWYENGNLISSNATVNVCPTATTVYEAEATYTACDGNVVTVTDQMTVTQNSSMTVSVNPPSATLCPGASIGLTASSSIGGVTYTWSPSAGLSSTSGANVTASPTQSTTYTVTADDGSCAASSNVTVDVGGVNVTATATDVGCAGNTGTVTATVTNGLAPIAYSWNTTPAQSTQTATGLVPGTYEVTVTDNAGCTATATATVGTGNNSISDPTITTTDAVCASQNGTATATPMDGTAPFTYSWNTTPIQTTQTATGLAAGTYQVTLTDATQCTVTATAVVALDGGNIVANAVADADVSCAGICDGAATVTIQGGAAPFTVLWDDPNSSTSETVTGLCGGTYNVTVSDVNGCPVTSQVTIAEPTAIQATANMTQQSECGQPNGEVIVTASGGAVATDYGYLWNSTPAQNTATATGLSPGSYTATVTDDNGCSVDATVDVTSTPSFGVAITAVQNPLCNGECTGTATVEADNLAVAPLSYAWGTSPAQNTATATGLCTGDHQVTVTDADGCIANVTATLSEPQPLNAIADADILIACIGQSVQLLGNASGGTAPYPAYQWDALPTDPSFDPTLQDPIASPQAETTYSLVVTDANGCVSEAATVTVQLRDPLVLTVVRPVSSPDTTICEGETAVIDLVASGGDGNYTYISLADGLPVNLPLVVQPDANTKYDFAVEDGCGTPTATATSTITVSPLPTVLFTVDSLAGCEPLAVRFEDASIPASQQWSWNFGDSGSSANTATSSSASHTYSQPGVYDVSLQVVSAQGCTNDTTYAQLIEVYPLPNAAFMADPTVAGLMDATINFTDLSEGTIAIWDWDLGDGASSALPSPVHTYQDTGVFQIALEVITAEGCADIARNSIEIRPEFSFYVPNAFTPNGNRRNDVFRPFGEGADWQSFEMSIFDRWGTRIFYTANIGLGWDGTYEGKQVPDGVYVYHISVTDRQAEQRSYIGRVNLIR